MFLKKRYLAEKILGKKGISTLYRGQDTVLNRVVAIKIFHETCSTSPTLMTRIEQGMQAAMTLSHPNIVQVYDYGQADGRYFVVMELIDGSDLRRYLRSRHILDVERTLIIAHDVAMGLGAAHRRGIIHGYVLTPNILIGRDGSIKLTDFGLGSEPSHTPEQLQGEPTSPATDIYALGNLMYEMLAGRRTFEGDTPVAIAMQHIHDQPIPPSQLNPTVPPALEKIILLCLEKAPENRYSDGNQLARVLEEFGKAEGF